MPPSPLMTIAVQRMPGTADLPLPAYATADAAGMDLLAAINGDITLAPMQRAMIATGIAIALPAGVEAQVRPRSGLAARHGVTVLNAPGTIDADYRGEIAVILVNFGSEPFVVSRGMRIAQMVLAACLRGSWQETETLPQSGRGAGGFGSTGLDGQTAPRSAGVS